MSFEGHAGASPGRWCELLAGDDVAERLGAAARRTARETFSLARTVERTRDLYHQILDRPRLATSPP